MSQDMGRHGGVAESGGIGLGRATLTPNRRPSLSAPTLLPSTEKKREERRVFLEADFWAELDDVARFHRDVFRAMGIKERVSRNVIIDAFLRWAVAAYWEDKGGKFTKQDRDEKVKAFAEQLRATANERLKLPATKKKK
jgi:hypothetical protein